MTEKQFLTAEDIEQITGRGETYAYKLIRKLNEELEAKGYLTIRGRVSTAYFFERLMYKGGDAE